MLGLVEKSQLIQGYPNWSAWESTKLSEIWFVIDNRGLRVKQIAIKKLSSRARNQKEQISLNKKSQNNHKKYTKKNYIGTYFKR